MPYVTGERLVMKSGVYMIFLSSLTSSVITEGATVHKKKKKKPNQNQLVFICSWCSSKNSFLMCTYG